MSSVFKCPCNLFFENALWKLIVSIKVHYSYNFTESMNYSSESIRNLLEELLGYSNFGAILVYRFPYDTSGFRISV